MINMLTFVGMKLWLDLIASSGSAQSFSQRVLDLNHDGIAAVI